MEQETKTNIFGKVFEWVKSHILIVAIIAAIIVVAIVLLCIFAGGPKKVVKSYIHAMNNQKKSEVVKCFDFAGKSAWGYAYDISDFDEDDYKKFTEEYNNISKEDMKNLKESLEKKLKNEFDAQEEDYKSYKMKINEFKKVKKLDKDLYVVRAVITIKAKPIDKDEEEIDETNTSSFIIYKNKIISMAF